MITELARAWGCQLPRLAGPTMAGVLALVLVLPVVWSEDPGPSEPSRITGFVIGHSMYVWYNPFRILFMQDPMFDYSLYPLPPDLSDSDKRKLDRVYYPRTRDELLNTYDLIVFHDARIQHFTPRQLHDLDYAFREAGVTAMNGLCLAWDSAWLPTILCDLVPISQNQAFRYAGYTVRFVRDRDPVFLPFLEYGVEKVVGSQLTEMTARQGAVVWGYMQPQNFPWLVSWRPGGKSAGMQWVVAHIFDSWWDQLNNPYALDVATNMIFYSTRMPLISDINARREARRLFATFQAQKSLILSMMEWSDNLGANTLPLSQRLNAVELQMDQAIDRYVVQDYATAITFLDSLSKEVSDIGEEAVRLKDEAMFWIYVSEWLVVTSTAIMAGFMVWTLMVRRRMYRAIQATRLRATQ